MTTLILYAFLTFTNYTDFSFVDKQDDTTPAAETYYLLTPSGNTLTTPSGDKLTIIH